MKPAIRYRPTSIRRTTSSSWTCASRRCCVATTPTGRTSTTTTARWSNRGWFRSAGLICQWRIRACASPCRRLSRFSAGSMYFAATWIGRMTKRCITPRSGRGYPPPSPEARASRCRVLAGTWRAWSRPTCLAIKFCTWRYSPSRTKQ